MDREQGVQPRAQCLVFATRLLEVSVAQLPRVQLARQVEDGFLIDFVDRHGNALPDGNPSYRIIAPLPEGRIDNPSYPGRGSAALPNSVRNPEANTQYFAKKSRAAWL
jgi:hypothetical protein